MGNWANPTTTSNYLDVPTEIKARDDDLALMFDSGTFSNQPTGAIRWNSANSRFEIWATPTPAVWNELDTEYAINVTSLSGLGIAAFLRLNPGADQTITSGKLILAPVGGVSAPLDLKGGTADFVQLQIFADSLAQSTRSAYIGYVSAGTQVLTIANEYANSNINLLPQGSGVVLAKGNEVLTDAGGQTIGGTLTATTFLGALTGSISGNAATVTTNANLTGGVTSVGNAATVITNANLTGGVTSVGNAATVITNANLTGGVTSVGNATTVITNANLTGSITSVGNATTVASAQPTITSVGTLSSLQVDNININLNEIKSTAGVDLLITPLGGQQIILDNTISIDLGVVTGASSITSTAFVGTLSTAAQGNITSLGILTSLRVDNLNFNLNTISTVAGTDLKITPLAGQQLILDTNIIIDAGVVTGVVALTTTTLTTTGQSNLTGDLVMTEKANHSVGTPAAGKGYLWLQNHIPTSLVYTNDAGKDIHLATQLVVSTANESVTFSSTLTNHTELVLTYGIGTYVVDVFLKWSAFTSIPGGKRQFTINASDRLALQGLSLRQGGSVTSLIGCSGGTQNSIIVVSSGAWNGEMFHGYMSATVGGTLQFKFAQDVGTSGESVTIVKGSYIKLTKVVDT